MLPSDWVARSNRERPLATSANPLCKTAPCAIDLTDDHNMTNAVWRRSWSTKHQDFLPYVEKARVVRKTNGVTIPRGDFPAVRIINSYGASKQ